jgi:hypothetical protein
MYHLVYLTTNLINNKIYVGVHSTYNLSDGYLGSGKTLRKAIKKYGKTNFVSTILHVCLTEDESLDWERFIVDSTFITSNNTYNIKLGGGNKVLLSDDIKQKIRDKAIGRIVSQQTKDKLSEIRKGKPLSEKNKAGISVALKGQPKTKTHIDNFIKANVGKQVGKRNGNAKSFLCISPDGIEYRPVGSMSQFCKDHNFDFSQVRTYYNKGKIQSCRKEKYRGWEFIVPTSQVVQI